MATTTQTSSFRQLSDGNTVGTIFGVSSTDVIGFYGVTTAVIKGTNVGVSSTWAVSSYVAGSSVGFATMAIASSCVSQVSSLVQQLTALGLIS